MTTFYNKANGTFTVSKNVLIGILLVALLALGGKVAYDGFQDAPAQKTYVDEFDMIDPDNPMTKSDNLIRLKKRAKDLEQERYACNEYIDRAKYSMAEQTKHNFPAPFVEKDTLDMEAIDFMSFYYRFPFFIQEDNTNTVYVYKPENVGNLGSESVKSTVERVKAQYTSVLLSHFRGANVWPVPDASGLLVFRKQNPAYPYNSQALENLPEEVSRIFDELVKTLENKRTAIDADIVSTSAAYESRMQEYKNTRYDMSGKAISWGIIAFVLTALTLYIAGLRSRDKMRSQVVNGDLSPVLHEDLKMSMWYSVYLITVLLLIITIFVLGLARLLSENTLAALLGGIAGYVLNNKQSDTPKNVTAYAAGAVRAEEPKPESVQNAMNQAAADQAQQAQDLATDTPQTAAPDPVPEQNGDSDNTNAAG